MRHWIHFKMNGADLGTFATFKSSPDYEKILAEFPEAETGQVQLTHETIEKARAITGLKLAGKQ